MNPTVRYFSYHTNKNHSLEKQILETPTLRIPQSSHIPPKTPNTFSDKKMKQKRKGNKQICKMVIWKDLCFTCRTLFVFSESATECRNPHRQATANRNLQQRPSLNARQNRKKWGGIERGNNPSCYYRGKS